MKFEVYNVTVRDGQETEVIYGVFEDPVVAIKFAQGDHPDAPRYEGCGGGGARVRVQKEDAHE